MPPAIGVAARRGSTRVDSPPALIGRWACLATIAVAFVLALAGCSGDAPTSAGTLTPAPPPTTFAGILDSIRREESLPALGAAIVTSDTVRRLDAVGVRRFGGTTPVTRDDRWHLGSVLKHQVAALVARLVSEGSLSWSTTLAEYFPELGATMRVEYRPRTLRDLLSHAAGLPRDYTANVADARAARMAAVRWAVDQAPVASTGTYAYSNVGYMLVGAIIDRATGQPFETVIAQRLWAPLGMTRAGFGQAGTPGLEDEPWGHWTSSAGTLAFYDAGTPNADNPPEYGPAGRAHMSLGDWGRFEAALLAAERGRDTPVLTSAAWRAMTSAPVVSAGNDGYGFGLTIAQRSWASGRALFHDGTNTRHYALVGLAPGQDFAILIATNQWRSTMGATMDRIFARLADYHLKGR